MFRSVISLSLAISLFALPAVAEKRLAQQPVVTYFMAVPGTPASLSWFVRNVSQCTLTKNGEVLFEGLPYTHTIPINPAESSNYSLICKGPGGEIQKSLDVESNEQGYLTNLFWETIDLGHLMNHLVFDVLFLAAYKFYINWLPFDR